MQLSFTELLTTFEYSMVHTKTEKEKLSDSFMIMAHQCRGTFFLFLIVQNGRGTPVFYYRL